MIHWADPLNAALYWLVWAVGMSLLAPGILARPWVGAALGAVVALNVVREPVEISILWGAAGFVLGYAAGWILADPLERLGSRAGTGVFGPELRTGLFEGGWATYRLAVAAYGLLLLATLIGFHSKTVPLGTYGGLDLLLVAAQFYNSRSLLDVLSPEQIHALIEKGGVVDVWSWGVGSIRVLAAIWINAAALGSFDRAVKGLDVDPKRFAEAGRRWFWRYLLWGLVVGVLFAIVSLPISLSRLSISFIYNQELPWRLVSTGLGWLGILLRTGFALPAVALLVLGRPIMPLLRRRWGTLLIGGLIVAVAGRLSYGELLVYPAWTLYVVALSQHDLHVAGVTGNDPDEEGQTA